MITKKTTRAPDDGKAGKIRGAALAKVPAATKRTTAERGREAATERTEQQPSIPNEWDDWREATRADRTRVYAEAGARSAPVSDAPGDRMARIDDAMRERARADLLEHLHHGARLAASLLEPEVARVLDAIRVRVARGERAILTSTADDAEKRVRQWATATLVDARKPRVEVGGRYDPTGTRGERTVPGDATARVTLSEAIERMLAFPWDLGERVCAERAFDLLYRAGFPDLKLKDDARWEVLKQQLEDKVLRGKWREQPLGRSTPGYVCAALRGLGLPTKQANSRVAAVERKIAERKHVPLTDEEAAMLTRCAEKEARRGRNVVEPDHIKQLPDVDVTEEERGE